MQEIEIKELVQYFFSKILILIISFVLIMVMGSVYVLMVKDPMYASSTTIVLTRLKDGENEEITSTDVQLNKSLISSYREIIKSKKVLQKVKEELKLKYTIEELRNMVEISTVKDTELISIRVNSKNKKETAKIANKIADVFSIEIKEIYHIQNVKIVDTAEMSRNPYNINPVKDMLMFMAIAFVVSSGIVFVIFYFDTKVKTTDEVENKFGFVILGEVPLEQKEKGGKRKWFRK